MREIKFKYGYSDSINTFEKAFTLEEIEQGLQFEEISDNPLLKNYKIVYKRQYTGLNDKNGIEIYEGDIILWYGGALKHIPIYSEVKWNREEARFSFGCKANSAYMFYNTEVVGNIYENPDLIKG